MIFRMLHIVMPGHSPSKTGVNALLTRGIHAFLDDLQDVDDRNKPGRDGILDFGTDFDE